MIERSQSSDPVSGNAGFEELLRPFLLGQRGPSRMKRRLAAVMSLDVKGYGLLMTENERDTHGRVGVALRSVLRETARFDGRVFSFAGDGLMAEFPSAAKVVACALRIQRSAARRNRKIDASRQIQYRIGINSGDVIDEDGRMGGDAINIAARLEQIAEPGTIYLTRNVFEQVARIVPARYFLLGERRLKNTRLPVTLYRATAIGSRDIFNVPDLMPSPDHRPSLAVLPFRTHQNDDAIEYFASGVVDDIIHALGGMRDLLVIARSSTIGFSPSDFDPMRAGKELGVRYVVHGSVRQAGDRLRIVAELFETDAGRVLWVERLDGERSDLFELQDRIAISVAGTIAPQIRERQLRMAMRKHPQNMTAYDLVLQAMAIFYRMDRNTFDEAQRLLQSAIAVDENYAPAWSNTAYWHNHKGWAGLVT